MLKIAFSDFVATWFIVFHKLVKMLLTDYIQGEIITSCIKISVYPRFMVSASVGLDGDIPVLKYLDRGVIYGI